MSNDKSNSCSSSASSEKKSKNSHSPSYSPVTYILGKRTRERESSSSDSFDSSDSSAQSIMWKEEWDEPYLDLLDRVTLRQFKGMKVFDNKLWHRFAQVLQEEVGSKEFNGNDCLRRGVSLRREYRKMDKSKRDPTARESKLLNIFRMPPRFPKGSCVMIPLREQVMELLEGSTSTSSGSSSRLRKRPRRPNQKGPLWKSNLIDALTYLVAEHSLRIDLMGKICSMFHTEMVDVFVKLPPCKQMEQLKILVGDCTVPLSREEQDLNRTTQPNQSASALRTTQPA